MLLPGAWQPTQSAFGICVAGAFGSRLLFRMKWMLYQSEPGPAAWQVRQAPRLTSVFQLSPCGVFGLAPVWQTVQLRRSCGKPTSE